MRLIDADALKSKAYPGYHTPGEIDPLVVELSDIDDAPTVAAIPAPVKCGECEFWDNDGVHIYGMCRNPNIGNVKMDTDFCSYGEKKDGTK